MHSFELPSNIRQIGSIAEGLKIYVEDYVCTYLKQYADAGGHCDRLAFLVGKDMMVDGQRYVFISGAIQGRFSVSEDGSEAFTDKSFEYLEEQLQAYFPGLDLVGWMQSQPGYGTVLNPAYADYHIEHFTKPSDILFVVDPTERTNAFYTWNHDATTLSEADGYYIYYDKNTQMQAYMTDNRLVLPRPFEAVTAPKASIRRARRDKAVPANSANDRDADTYDNDVAYDEPPRKPSDYRRVVNMLVSLSAVLVVVCFIMGMGLAQSDNRISRLEKDLTSLNSTYAYLVSQVRSIGTMPVFAEQDPSDNSEAAGQPPLEGSSAADNADLTGLSTADNPDAATPDAVSQAPSPSPIVPSEAAAATPTPTTDTTQSSVAQAQPTQPAAPVDTPVPSAEAPVANNDDVAYESYIVQQGDSLLRISHQFYGDASMVDEIMELNGLSDPDKIFFGKVLKLPRQ